MTMIRLMNFTLFRLSKFFDATISILKKRRRACEIVFLVKPWANTGFMVRDGAVAGIHQRTKYSLAGLFKPRKEKTPVLPGFDY